MLFNFRKRGSALTYLQTSPLPPMPEEMSLQGFTVSDEMHATICATICAISQLSRGARLSDLYNGDSTRSDSLLIFLSSLLTLLVGAGVGSVDYTSTEALWETDVPVQASLTPPTVLTLASCAREVATSTRLALTLGVSGAGDGTGMGMGAGCVGAVTALTSQIVASILIASPSDSVPRVIADTLIFLSGTRIFTSLTTDELLGLSALAASAGAGGGAPAEVALRALQNFSSSYQPSSGPTQPALGAMLLSQITMNEGVTPVASARVLDVAASFARFEDYIGSEVPNLLASPEYSQLWRRIAAWAGAGAGLIGEGAVVSHALMSTAQMPKPEIATVAISGATISELGNLVDQQASIPYQLTMLTNDVATLLASERLLAARPGVRTVVAAEQRVLQALKLLPRLVDAAATDALARMVAGLLGLVARGPKQPVIDDYLRDQTSAPPASRPGSLDDDVSHPTPLFPGTEGEGEEGEGEEGGQAAVVAGGAGGGSYCGSGLWRQQAVAELEKMSINGGHAAAALAAALAENGFAATLHALRFAPALAATSTREPCEHGLPPFVPALAHSDITCETILALLRARHVPDTPFTHGAAAASKMLVAGTHAARRAARLALTSQVATMPRTELGKIVSDYMFLLATERQAYDIRVPHEIDAAAAVVRTVALIAANVGAETPKSAVQRLAVLMVMAGLCNTFTVAQADQLLAACKTLGTPVSHLIWPAIWSALGYTRRILPLTSTQLMPAFFARPMPRGKGALAIAHEAALHTLLRCLPRPGDSIINENVETGSEFAQLVSYVGGAFSSTYISPALHMPDSLNDFIESWRPHILDPESTHQPNARGFWHALRATPGAQPWRLPALRQTLIDLADHPDLFGDLNFYVRPPRVPSSLLLSAGAGGHFISATATAPQPGVTAAVLLFPAPASLESGVEAMSPTSAEQPAAPTADQSHDLRYRVSLADGCVVLQGRTVEVTMGSNRSRMRLEHAAQGVAVVVTVPKRPGAQRTIAAYSILRGSPIQMVSSGASGASDSLEARARGAALAGAYFTTGYQGRFTEFITQCLEGQQEGLDHRADHWATTGGGWVSVGQVVPVVLPTYHLEEARTLLEDMLNATTDSAAAKVVAAHAAKLAAAGDAPAGCLEKTAALIERRLTEYGPTEDNLTGATVNTIARIADGAGVPLLMQIASSAIEQHSFDVATAAIEPCAQALASIPALPPGAAVPPPAQAIAAAGAADVCERGLRSIDSIPDDLARAAFTHTVCTLLAGLVSSMALPSVQLQSLRSTLISVLLNPSLPRGAVAAATVLAYRVETTVAAYPVTNLRRLPHTQVAILDTAELVLAMSTPHTGAITALTHCTVQLARRRPQDREAAAAALAAAAAHHAAQPGGAFMLTLLWDGVVGASSTVVVEPDAFSVSASAEVSPGVPPTVQQQALGIVPLPEYCTCMFAAIRGAVAAGGAGELDRASQILQRAVMLHPRPPSLEGDLAFTVAAAAALEPGSERELSLMRAAVTLVTANQHTFDPSHVCSVLNETAHYTRHVQLRSSMLILLASTSPVSEMTWDGTITATAHWSGIWTAAPCPAPVLVQAAELMLGQAAVMTGRPRSMLGAQAAEFILYTLLNAQTQQALASALDVLAKHALALYECASNCISIMAFVAFAAHRGHEPALGSDPGFAWLFVAPNDETRTAAEDALKSISEVAPMEISSAFTAMEVPATQIHAPASAPPTACARIYGRLCELAGSRRASGVRATNDQATWAGAVIDQRRAVACAASAARPHPPVSG